MHSSYFNISEKLVKELRKHVYLPEEVEQRFRHEIYEAHSSIGQDNYHLFDNLRPGIRHILYNSSGHDEFTLYALIRNKPYHIIPDSFKDLWIYLLDPNIPPKTNDSFVRNIHSNTSIRNALEKSYNYGNPYSLIVLHKELEELYSDDIPQKRTLYRLETPILVIPLPQDVYAEHREAIEKWEEAWALLV